jgi:hypothetical protein
MRQTIVTVPDLILLAGTRVALGAGIGLLISRRLRQGTRKGAGWALVAIGGLTTIPLIMKLRAGGRPHEVERAEMGPWAQRQTHAESTIHSPS